MNDEELTNSSNTMDLLSLPPECLGEVLKFSAEPNVLCALDATCRFLQSKTPELWGQLAMEKFGIQKENGKQAWRQGNMLTRNRRDHFMFQLGHPVPLLRGSTQMAASESTVAIGFDAGHAFDESVTGEHPLLIRDTRTLNFLQTCPHQDMYGFQVALCGPDYAELIVRANANRVVAHQGPRDFEIHLDGLNEHEWPFLALLGSSRHLIVFCMDRLYLFKPGTDPLLSLEASAQIVIPDHYNNLAVNTEDTPRLCWDENQTTFAFSAIRNTISVWKIESKGGADTLEHVQEIHDDTAQLWDDDIADVFESVAIGERYIAGCLGRTRQLRIYDRHSGENLHALYDVDDRPELREEDMIFPLQMEVVAGDLLVTTSFAGHAICVWNMRTGQLLQKYTDFIDRGLKDRLENINNHVFSSVGDVVSMVRLPGLPYTAFLVLDGFLTLWAFPEDNESRQRLLGMKEREDRLVQLRSNYYEHNIDANALRIGAVDESESE